MQVHIQAQTGTNRHAFPQKFGQKDIHTGSNQKRKNILHIISDWLIQTPWVTGSNQKPENILHTISDWLIQTFTLNIT